MADLRIESVRLLSREPDRLAEFFASALGFSVEAPGRLRLGEERVRIERADGAPYPADMPSNDTRFQHFAVIVSDMEAAYRHLQSVPGWTPISMDGPQRLPDASGGVTAFKFRSPDGHPLELLQFPAGQAPAPWDSRPGLYLGIDHSAIGIAETQASIDFYRRLGFEVSSRQTNRGAEQARLDGLSTPDPVVEVTALTPSGGAPPHLELLCYRQPAALRAAPAGEADVAATAFILSGMTSAMQDPDGHRLLPDN